MKQQRILVFPILTLIGLGLILLGGLALAQDQEPDQWILREDELPEGARIKSKPLELDDFSGPPSILNAAMQAEGFLSGYVAEGEYPCEFHGESFRELVVEGSGVVGVLNVVYQFHSDRQATAQIERAIDLIKQAARQEDFEKSQANIEYLKLDSLLRDESPAADNKMQGQIVRTTWVERDVKFVSHVFFGAQDSTFIFLAVDGFNDPAAQEAFETVVLKLLQR